MDLNDATRRVRSLRDRLQAIVDKDPEQEVRGIAIPVIDAVLTEARSVLPPDDPAVETVAGLITPETIAEGEPIRAVDALLAVDQLCEALTYANRFNEGTAIG